MSIFVNEQEVVFGEYPNGETIVPEINISPAAVDVIIRLHWETDADLTRLLLVQGLLKQQSGWWRPNLLIDYLPYSRMDREQDGCCFSLRHVADLINWMDFQTVYIVEPHSDVTLSLIKSAIPIWATAKLTPLAMGWMGFNKRTDVLVLPDKGAYKRYYDLMADLMDTYNVLVMDKNRDFATGKILGLKIDSVTMRGENFGSGPGKALIIDDLCSRGGTFVEAASVLRVAGYKGVNLLVTHMEPAGLQGDLPKKLDRVFFTDTISVPRPIPDNFEIFPRKYWM